LTQAPPMSGANTARPQGKKPVLDPSGADAIKPEGRSHAFFMFDADDARPEGKGVSDFLFDEEAAKAGSKIQTNFFGDAPPAEPRTRSSPDAAAAREKKAVPSVRAQPHLSYANERHDAGFFVDVKRSAPRMHARLDLGDAYLQHQRRNRARPRGSCPKASALKTHGPRPRSRSCLPPQRSLKAR